MKRFEDVFGMQPMCAARAPGRVNLLGEHTDYNGGFVLPIAIPQDTEVAVGWSEDEVSRVYSADLDQLSQWQSGALPEDFGRYVLGCVLILQQKGFTMKPLNFWVHSTVPMGSGLSSSAALEVATLRALRLLLNLDLSDEALALMAQEAEIQYAGVACGIMDQMASSLADTKNMLFLDTRTLERRAVALPEATEILVLDSGVPRTLAGSGYNLRRAECEQAARLLGVEALRDVVEPSALDVLPEPLRKRARHVVTENARVLEAAAGVTAGRFGALMNASHLSLRDDYEVSTPLLDRLVTCLQVLPEVYGARLTGAGFGGACVALVEVGTAQSVARRALDAYAMMGGTGSQLVPMLEQF